MSGLDLVIRGGTVIDGTGADGYIADVGMAGGKIVEIGKIAPNGAQRHRCRGAHRHPRLHRWPHPYGCPDALGPSRRQFVLARGDHAW